MKGKAVICFILLVAMVGLVSADTLIAYPNEVADIYGALTHNQTWSSVHDYTGTGVVETATNLFCEIRSDAETNKWYIFKRFSMLAYNTSTIGSSNTITNVTIQFRTIDITVNDYSSSLDLVSVDTGLTKLDNSNYPDFTTTLYASKPLSEISTSVANYTLPLTDYSRINKTGLTNYAFRISQDRTNTEPSWISGVKRSKVTFSPVEGNFPLTITYSTGGDITPPASIIGLNNQSTCTEINWTWTNPGDADFNHTMIYQNGTFLHNVSNTTTFDLWTGLAELTAYTFSSHTCDITGNCNSTWVNATSTTLTCVTPTPTPTPSGNITINLVSKSTNFIHWNWSIYDSNISVRIISLNGKIKENYDYSNSYIATGLQPDSWYEIRLFDINNTFLISNSQKTDATRETAQEGFFTLSNVYLLLLIGIICCIVGVFVPFIGLIAVLIGISGLVGSFNTNFNLGVIFFILILAGLIEGITSLF